jgi:hypothetical protein
LDSSLSDPEQQNKPSKRRGGSPESLARQLAGVLGLATDVPDLIETILNQVTDLVYGSTRKVASRDGFVKQELEIKERRIQDLESMLAHSQRLCKDTEAKLDDKLATNQELLRQIDEQQQRIEELEATLRRVLVACESSEPEAAVSEIQRLKREQRERELYEAVDIDSRIAGLIASRTESFDSICRQIDEQGRSVQADLHALDEMIAADEDDQFPKEIARTLESTNRLLAERLEQLRAARIYDSDESEDETPPRKARRKRAGAPNGEGLGPSLWLSKTRDVLSLERQMHDVNRRLDHAVTNCHLLARENHRLHVSLEGQPGSLPETLL